MSATEAEGNNDQGNHYYVKVVEVGMSPRIETFLHSVAFVHDHRYATVKRGHRVVLNVDNIIHQ